MLQFNLLGSIGNLLSNSANTPLLKTNDGFLYGTTDSDGTGFNLSGSFFKFNPSNGALTILHHFAIVGNIPEPGSLPDAPLIRGNDGKLLRKRGKDHSDRHAHSLGQLQKFGTAIATKRATETSME